MRTNNIGLPQITTSARLGRFWSVSPRRSWPALSPATAWCVNHQSRLRDKRCNFNFPIERVSTRWTDNIPVVRSFDRFLRNDVVLEERYFTPTVYIGTDRRFDPEGVNNVSFKIIRDLRLIQTQQRFFQWSSFIPGHRSRDEAIKRSF